MSWYFRDFLFVLQIHVKNIYSAKKWDAPLPPLPPSLAPPVATAFYIVLFCIICLFFSNSKIVAPQPGRLIKAKESFEKDIIARQISKCLWSGRKL